MNSHALLALRLLVGGLLLWAGTAKLLDPGVFFHALLDYRLPLPDAVLRFVAVTAPWLEVLVGGLLLTGGWARAVRGLALAQSIVFVAVTGQALARGLEITCGCFGGGATEWDTAEFAFARAVALLIASAVLVGAARSTTRANDRRTRWSGLPSRR